MRRLAATTKTTEAQGCVRDKACRVMPVLGLEDRDVMSVTCRIRARLLDRASTFVGIGSMIVESVVLAVDARPTLCLQFARVSDSGHRQLLRGASSCTSRIAYAAGGIMSYAVELRVARKNVVHVVCKRRCGNRSAT